ncbi:MAG: hypothetical protein WCG47_05780 [Dermatophilaceae bacterium]
MARPAARQATAGEVVGGRGRRHRVFGLLVHNIADLPDQTLLSPQTLWPSVVTASLLGVYAAGTVRLAGMGLFGWALLNLVGGPLSVAPIPVLPFEPEQTLRHYSFPLLYAATQLPLLVVSYRFAACQPLAPSREAAQAPQPRRCANPSECPRTHHRDRP